MAAKKMSQADKYLYGIAALVISIVSAIGFFLIVGDPPIKNLVVSGHAHALLFGLGAIAYGFLMEKLGWSEDRREKKSILMSLTYLGPLALIYAGMSGNTGHLMWTSPLFEGLFVLLWLSMAVNYLSDSYGK